MQDLERRWSALWRRLGAQGDAGAAYADLAARYSEPHRAYHTLQHIGEGLEELDAFGYLASNPDTVELAFWFHDAVYDTRTKDSEDRSGTLAVSAVRSASLSEAIGRSVDRLIAATKHAESPEDPDARLLVDVDLSILGKDEARFDEYERQIRREYHWVPEEAFVAGRSAILRSFLDRPRIYATEPLREAYEARARQNMERSLARLSA